MGLLRQIVRERTADADTTPALEGLWRDLRHAMRGLNRSRVFTATAVLTLAIGVGATTAVFTLVQQVMLRQLPVARPEQLWRIGSAVRCCHSTGYAQNEWSFFSWEAYKRFRENTPEFEQLAALQVGQAELAVRRAGSSSAAEARIGEYVSGNFFATLGTVAWRGRLFTDADDKEGMPPVAVMNFRTWQENYGADSSVIGAVYDINGHSFTIVGVTPPGFLGAKIAGSGMPELWLPLTTEPVLNGATSRLKNTGEAWLDVIGRLPSSRNVRTLEARLQVELQQWLTHHERDMTAQERTAREKQTLHLTAAGSGVSLMRESYEGSLRLLMLAASCVLLVACANIANLLLARGLKDRQQMALRAALGASRGQLVRRALTESLVLGAFGALSGIAVAYFGASLILHLAFGGSHAWAPVSASPSLPVLFFALGLSGVSVLVFGMAPALMTAQADPIEALHGANRSIGGGPHGLQRMLMIAQVAVSVVLLTGAALLGQSLRNLENQDFGFDTNGRYLVSINAMLANYKPEELVPVLRGVEARLRGIPGVRAASPALYAPLSEYYWDHNIQIEGQSEPTSHDASSSAWTRVMPGFLETLGDRIVMGQSITEANTAATHPVAVVNEAFVRRFLGRENPIGRRFGPTPGNNASMYEIIGVASNVRYFAGMRDRETPMYFLPEAQATRFDDADLQSREVWSHYPYSIVVWAPGKPVDLERQVRAALAEVDPRLVIYDLRSYADVIRSVFSQQNMIARLASLFGAIGLALAAVGLYGVTAYGVEGRTREIGVRMALGADRTSVVVMVLRSAFVQIGAGLALGIPAAIGAGQLIANQLFDVRPWDVSLLCRATLLLLFAALVAAGFPARDAASVSPMEALRRE